MSPTVRRGLSWGLGMLVLLALGWPLLSWALWRAEFSPDAAACQALAHQGACWGVVPARGLNLLFGHYPIDQLWRPWLWLAALAMASLWVAWHTRHANSGFLAARRQAWRFTTGLVLAWLAGLWLLGGGLGLPSVPSSQWGGLPLTLVIAGGSYLLSWPLALGLALARSARSPLWRVPATVVIEGVRGVPLVTLMFAAAFLLPRLTPSPDSLSLLTRATLTLAVFSSAYLAEILRAGLQAVPDSQQESAWVLGLGHWGTQAQVVLPQAIRAVWPALTGHAIGLLKESSLVMVIGLHELTGALSLSLGGDPLWRPFYFEAYLFVGLIYGLMCWALSAWSRRLERHWAAA